jgi:hypothetical protein
MFFPFALLVAILIFRPQGCWVARWWPRFKGSNMAEVSRKPGLDIRRCLIDSILAGFAR